MEEFQDIQDISNISIKLHNFSGLEFIDDETDFEIVASSALESEVFCDYQENVFKTSIQDLKIYYTFSIDTTEEDEILKLFSNPLNLTLIRHENQESDKIAFAGIDLLPLFSIHAEERAISLSFLNFKKHLRKITFDAHISSDLGLLKIPYENYFLITIDAFYYLSETEDSIFNVGFKIPFNNENDKTVISKINLSMVNATKYESRMKKWCNEEHISNSVYRNEAQREQFQGIESCDKLQINTIMRSMFANNAMYLRIRESKHIVIEIELNGRHLIGLIDCEELLYVNNKKLRQLVELHDFEKEKVCDFESVFKNEKKSIDAGESNRPIFIEIEIELEKPLHQEIYQEQAELCDIIKIHDNRLLEQFKGELLLTSRQLIKKHDGENVNEIIKKIISNGEFSQIEQQMTDKLEKNFNSVPQSHLISHVINDSTQISTYDNLLIANIYAVLGMNDTADDILLSNLADDRNSEKAWCDFLIFNARQQNYDKMDVGLDELLKINEKSRFGNLLMAYKFFKLRKTSECLNFIRFLKTTYGAIEEMNIIEHVVNRMAENENLLCKSSMIENVDVGSVYERSEILWNSSALNWKNPFIRCAVFCIKIGCYEFAELCLGEYYERYGVNFNYLYLLAAIDTSRGDYANALIHLKKIARDDVASHHVNYADVINAITLNLLLANKIDEAKTLVINQDCDNFLISYLLGVHYKNQNDYEIAKEFLIQAVKIIPFHLSFQALAECLIQLGHFDRAEYYLKMAINSKFDDAQESWDKLREIYAKLGRNELKNCVISICVNNLIEKID